MSHKPPRVDPLSRRANTFYWQSNRSVNQIAAEMDLSKGTLYGLIDPLLTDLACPRCSSSLAYANRTARDRGLLSCPNCGVEGDEGALSKQRQHAASTGQAVPGQGVPTHRARAAATLSPALRDPVLIGIGLLLAAAGFWLLQELRRRP